MSKPNQTTSTGAAIDTSALIEGREAWKHENRTGERIENPYDRDTHQDIWESFNIGYNNLAENAA